MNKKQSVRKIAEILKVHRSTIYREIKRNSTRFKHDFPKDHYYYSFFAHRKYLDRRKSGTKIFKNEHLREYVFDKLKEGWSPWQIEGRLRLENNGKCVISHESIYRFIYSDAGFRNQVFKKLRRKHFWRVKHKSRKRRVPKELLIENRPEYINNRSEFGHWECDLMMFKHGIKSNLITLRERTSRYVIAIKNESKDARITAMALISTITNIKNQVKSITFDQGSEFMRFNWIRSCLEADIYFCDPGRPEQKGSVENGNGVIRVELPRNFNIDELKQKDITAVTREINNRPLKCLDYRTPQELFFEYKNIKKAVNED
jgi:transposase, IS30 family